MSKRSFGQIPKPSLRTTRSRQNQLTGSSDVSRKHYIGRVGSEAEEDLSLGCTPDHPIMKHVLHRSISPVSSISGPSSTKWHRIIRCTSVCNIGRSTVISDTVTSANLYSTDVNWRENIGSSGVCRAVMSAYFSNGYLVEAGYLYPSNQPFGYVLTPWATLHIPKHSRHWATTSTSFTPLVHQEIG